MKTDVASLSDPFEHKFWFFGQLLHTIETSTPPLRSFGSTALPELFSILKNEMLPATVAIDVLRGVSSFMADGVKIGEHSVRTGADMLGELAGGLPASAGGVALGETVGAGIGTFVGGPLGAISGSAVGGFIGSVTGSIGGSYVGARLSEYVADRLGFFGQTQPSYFAARSPK